MQQQPCSYCFLNLISGQIFWLLCLDFILQQEGYCRARALRAPVFLGSLTRETPLARLMIRTRRLLRSSQPQEICQPPPQGFLSVHAQLQLLGYILRLFTRHTSHHLTILTPNCVNNIILHLLSVLCTVVNVRNKIIKVLKVWWHAATLFIYFYINRAYIQFYICI